MSDRDGAPTSKLLHCLYLTLPFKTRCISNKGKRRHLKLLLEWGRTIFKRKLVILVLKYGFKNKTVVKFTDVNVSYFGSNRLSKSSSFTHLIDCLGKVRIRDLFELLPFFIKCQKLRRGFVIKSLEPPHQTLLKYSDTSKIYFFVYKNMPKS